MFFCKPFQAVFGEGHNRDIGGTRKGHFTDIIGHTCNISANCLCRETQHFSHFRNFIYIAHHLLHEGQQRDILGTSPLTHSFSHAIIILVLKSVFEVAFRVFKSNCFSKSQLARAGFFFCLFVLDNRNIRLFNSFAPSENMESRRVHTEPSALDIFLVCLTPFSSSYSTSLMPLE